MQVLEPHTLHAGTHEGKASFLIIYISIHIQRKSFVFWFYQRRLFVGKYDGPIFFCVGFKVYIKRCKNFLDIILKRKKIACKL